MPHNPAPAGHSIEQVQHNLPPGVNRIVFLNKRKSTDTAGELEQDEDDVIGVSRRLTAQEGLSAQGRS